MPPWRPTQLGPWEVIAKIAGGGMSAVYLGRRLEPVEDQPNVVALKVVKYDARLDERMQQMFLAEGRLLSRLEHPNIVRTLEAAGDAEHSYIAMELLLGKTFAAVHDAVAARGVRLHADVVAWTAARIADALHHAHELGDAHGRPLGLVHRDVNPANVFATFAGEVKLFDFGLAKATAGETAGSRLLAGKLSYLSPEQIMQMPLDRRSDVFSLGTTLWELLTSRRLFRRGTDAETVRAVQLGPIPDPRTVAPEIPEELARIVRRSLERNREHRYPTAAELAADLDRFLAGRTSAADAGARIAQLVDQLFPGEQKRQVGWLKPSPSRQLAAVSPFARRTDSSPRALDATVVDGLPAFGPPPSSQPMPSSSRPDVPAPRHGSGTLAMARPPAPPPLPGGPPSSARPPKLPSREMPAPPVPRILAKPAPAPAPGPRPSVPPPSLGGARPSVPPPSLGGARPSVPPPSLGGGPAAPPSQGARPRRPPIPLPSRASRPPPPPRPAAPNAAEAPSSDTQIDLPVFRDDE